EKKAESMLPKTGEFSSNTTSLGMFVLGLVGLLSFKTKKKKDENK
ncbi:TPA: LPXTG cell wall anchor domain-containing protein, partial [Clostridium perfringens]|nr:LPXTG cell wall anchor domain-containing protein [Clostridium perfringens]